MNSTYTIKPGDTFSSIARRHGCTTKEVESINKNINPLRLIPGTPIQIPNARNKLQTQRPVDAKPAPVASQDAPREGSCKLVEIVKPISGDAGLLSTAALKLCQLSHSLADDLLAWLREVESTEHVHQSTKTKTELRKPGETPQSKAQQNKSKTNTAARKHRDEVLNLLHQRLHATPHVITTTGVKLSFNERKKIIAAAGLCEINNDVFGSENTDQEFVGRKFGKRGIETGYSRIVHIGLSYGYIQYTQDSGSLGRLLQRMLARNEKNFRKLFPNADQLITLTTIGLTDPNSTRFGTSGQAYFNRLPKQEKKKLRDLTSADKDGDNKPDNPLSENEEIRGARVQKIPYAPGHPAIDLWEQYKEKPTINGAPSDYYGYADAFKAAGEVPEFQDVQIELAVEDYLNPILPHCKQINARTASALTFIAACAIRGGPASRLAKLFGNVANARLGTQKFTTNDQEIETLQAIRDSLSKEKSAGGKNSRVPEVAGIQFDADEARRAGIILSDAYDFLSEDLYDTNTYENQST